MTDAVLLTGGGDFDDPWHPFRATAARIAQVLDGLGVRTTIVDGAAGFADAVAAGPDLVVVQASNAYEPTSGDDLVLDAVAAHLAGGRPLLAVHSATCLFVDRPEWAATLGGRWVPEESYHPELGEAHVRLEPHPITAGLVDVEAVDERYTALSVSPEVGVLAWHEEAGARHPLAWTHRVGGANVVYDALGHDERSYDSPSRRALLEREVGWLLSPAAAPPPAGS
ncbi:ThuA domain-containing protein [Protaetiibacter intestinalis]|uniref:ThuA domain-containing protein n=1 Tax=Protaetiibacter intestinalis TaxID=2419774 RepID=A0A387B757_9MICO|nr:ThuA domain-containing protein [Protaetiibacter intestinalis]AYF98183.1 ThuA domain-containing protein [Protaetiibacter intestinalis]